jgi:hypothetical protein
MNFQSIQAKQKQKKNSPKIDKIFGMLQTTTLKRNLVLEIGEARKKVGFGLPRWLPPLKGTFVGCQVFGFRRGTPWFLLGTGSSSIASHLQR